MGQAIIIARTTTTGEIEEEPSCHNPHTHPPTQTQPLTLGVSTYLQVDPKLRRHQAKKPQKNHRTLPLSAHLTRYTHYHASLKPPIPQALNPPSPVFGDGALVRLARLVGSSITCPRAYA